jgi:hypothetical protein
MDEGRSGEVDEDCGLRPDDAGWEPAVMAATLWVRLGSLGRPPIEDDEEECARGRQSL